MKISSNKFSDRFLKRDIALFIGLLLLIVTAVIGILFYKKEKNAGINGKYGNS